MSTKPNAQTSKSATIAKQNAEVNQTADQSSTTTETASADQSKETESKNDMFAGIAPENSLAANANKDFTDDAIDHVTENPETETIKVAEDQISTEETKTTVLPGIDLMDSKTVAVNPVTASGKSIQPNENGKVWLYDTNKEKIISGPIDVRYAERQVKEFKHVLIVDNPNHGK